MSSKFKATKCVWLSIDSHHFHSMSIGPPIPGIWLFQYLTLKIQGQGDSAWSHSGSYILSIYIPFVPCYSTFPFLKYSFFKIRQRNSSSRSRERSKFKATECVPLPIYSQPCHSVSTALLFLWYILFSIWPWKPQVKVISPLWYTLQV